jgi:hypothetical protein
MTTKSNPRRSFLRSGVDKASRAVCNPSVIRLWGADFLVARRRPEEDLRFVFGVDFRRPREDDRLAKGVSKRGDYSIALRANTICMLQS